MPLPSEFDVTHFPISRAFVDARRRHFIERYLKRTDRICDIGNQGKDLPELEGYALTTLDITAETGPDIVADITRYNAAIPENHFDALLCTEVLEHVVDPFSAIREVRRITKVGGYLFITTPLNSRIHGPVPDCWRFTEFGLRVLLRDLEIVEFDKLDTPQRNLFPLHYGVIARKHRADLAESDASTMQFQRVE